MKTRLVIIKADQLFDANNNYCPKKLPWQSTGVLLLNLNFSTEPGLRVLATFGDPQRWRSQLPTPKQLRGAH
ncbi:MAG: hypothetical protein AAFO04_30140, partial [Cyanobacteria bacterium J06592_8]